MIYAYTILYINDVAKTIAFYEEAFGFKRKFITPEGDYGELDTGATTIAFANLELASYNFSKGISPITNTDKPAGMELAFVSENIEGDFQKAVDAGASIYEPIIEKPWGQKVGYLRDINGTLIEICTPVKSK